MARTVVYDASKDRPADGAASKIAKYVPAEMVALATLFFASFTVSETMLWIAIAVGAGLNVIYLYSISMNAKDSPPPRQYFYWLSAAAFVLWSLATIDVVAKAVGLSGNTSDGQRAFVLLLAAFAVPMLDTVLSGLKVDRGQVDQDASAPVGGHAARRTAKKVPPGAGQH